MNRCVFAPLLALALFLCPLVAAFAASRVSSPALEASRVIRSRASTLLSVTGHNSKASAQFIQLHDAAALPADGVVPVLTFTVPANSNFSLVFPVPMAFDAGVVVCNSATLATKTIGAADCFFTAQIE